MSYATARSIEIRASFDRRLADFAAEYNPNAKTVILLPGGMGSQLNRSMKKYRDDASLPLGDYRPIWIALGILFGDGPLLAIDEEDHDLGDHVIVPDGPLRFFLMNKPYDITERYLREAGYNFIVFGYDWRRPLAESVALFHDFLKRLRQKIRAIHNDDPLPKATLLCHSMGGLVAKLLLHRLRNAAGAADWFERIVTVGTPFYGTSTHMGRYYKGQAPLDRIYGPRRVAELCGTMPGPYILLFLDEQTYQSDGADIGLNRYPVRDADDPSVAVDPHDAGNLGRFPPWVLRKHLSAAARVQQAISDPLTPGVMKKVFNIRSGNDKRTISEILWRRIDGSVFDPGAEPAPISAVGGAGDGTVPYWSARLAAVPNANVFDLQHAFDHGSLLEHGETLEAVYKLIDTGVLPGPIAVPEQVPTVAKASKDELDQFIEEVAAGQITREDPRAMNPRVWRRLLEELNP